MTFKLTKADFNKNPHLGIYFKANNEFLLAPKNTPEKTLKTLVETLEVTPIKMTIDNSHYLGIYGAMNDNGILIPESISRDELAILKKHFNVGEMPYPVCAISNSVLCNNKYAAVSEDFPHKLQKIIADALNVEVLTVKLESHNVGAQGVANNNGVLCGTLMHEHEQQQIEKIFKIKTIRGSVNFGLPYVNLGIIANDKGAVVGSNTTGIEIQKIYEGLS
ncbi:Translation initiation factor 6 [uncultured archaeon]|nr:Translation initiation factor 6 [uncultured archaeon]